VAAFRKGLSETGFVEGHNLIIEFRWAQNDRDRLSELAAELIRRKVDVIAVPGTSLGALAAKALTTTIPIVFGTVTDPIQQGLVTSLNRPGGNVTGFTDMGDELMPKRLGLLHELLPRAARFCVLISPTRASLDRMTTDAQTAAAAIGAQLDILLAGTGHEIETAFAELLAKRCDAILMYDDAVLAGRMNQILTLAARHAVPAMYGRREWADAGGLMSYGPFVNDQARQTGIYVGRILKGENPGDLPVARASKFEFVINLATARAIGIDVSPILLATADEVIE
jgi:putative tryptophan/tyrosine transport system substrate-binding protein